MLTFLSFILKIIISLARSKKSLVIKVSLLEKELEILKRSKQKRAIPKQADRIILALLNILYDIKNSISIFQPETILKWQRNIIKGHWTFQHGKAKPGRPPVTAEIKQLVLRIKNDNIYIGIMKIQGELLKLGIELDRKTIWNILRDFRRKGKLKQSLTWKKFLKMQANSIYAMDFFTVDTIMKQRFYVYFIIHHKTRELIQFAVTMKPVKEFVRQQIISFSNSLDDTVCMIRDRAAQFDIDYLDYGIKEIVTSTKAPNMNSIAERFIGSARREVLDHFLIISERQLNKILWEYVEYYNSNRPHQGIQQQSPKGYVPMRDGEVRSKPVLSGLWHHYYREAA